MVTTFDKVFSVIMIVYYIFALITFIQFKRKRIQVTGRNDKSKKRLENKFILYSLQISYSMVWPVILVKFITFIIKEKNNENKDK